MRLLILLFFLCLCATSARADWHVVNREALPSAPGTEFTRLDAADEGGAVSVRVFVAQMARHTIEVIDDASGTLSVATAGGQDAVATVNGGYFQEDHEPLGLVISGGSVLHGLQRSPLLTGLVVASPNRVSLLRLAEYKPSPAHHAALQAGPFLVDGGHPVAGLNANRSAARTAVFTTKDGAFGVVTMRSATLAEAAQIMAIPQLLGRHPIVRALNLDGGSSTGLWVRQPGTAFYSREFKSVRTYLAIVPR